jgi:hypothetical protein
LFDKTGAALSTLSKQEMKSLFNNVPCTRMVQEAGLTLLDVCMRCKCFSHEGNFFMNGFLFIQKQYD